jgi:hypothetical protein
MELDDLFLEKPLNIRQMYEKLHSECSKFCKLTTDITRCCIYFVDDNWFYWEFSEIPPISLKDIRSFQRFCSGLIKNALRKWIL